MPHDHVHFLRKWLNAIDDELHVNVICTIVLLVIILYLNWQAHRTYTMDIMDAAVELEVCSIKHW